MITIGRGYESQAHAGYRQVNKVGIIVFGYLKAHHVRGGIAVFGSHQQAILFPAVLTRHDGLIGAMLLITQHGYLTTRHQWHVVEMRCRRESGHQASVHIDGSQRAVGTRDVRDNFSATRTTTAFAMRDSINEDELVGILSVLTRHQYLRSTGGIRRCDGYMQLGLLLNGNGRTDTCSCQVERVVVEYLAAEAAHGYSVQADSLQIGSGRGLRNEEDGIGLR